MQTITVSRTVEAPASRVWEALDDFGGIHRLHPLIERSPLLNGQPSGVGAERECHFYSGGSIKERVTARDEGRRLGVTFTDVGPFPMKDAHAEFALRPLGAGRTETTFRFDFTPKFGPLGVLMAKTVMGAQLRKSMNALLQGLDDHLRTGKHVGPKGVLVAA